MPQYIHARHLGATAAVLMAFLLIVGCMSGCQSQAANPNDTTDTLWQPEVETLPEDTRVLTDDSVHQNRLDTAFAGAEPVAADRLIYNAESDSVTIIGYLDLPTLAVLPSEIDGLPVTAIEARAFAGSSVQALSIPDTVTRIGLGAFEDCTKLTTLKTPLCTGGTEPNSAYFGYLFGASSYEINAGSVPDSLLTVLLSEPLAEIPSYAFYGCNDVTALSIPDTVTRIGSFAFAACSDLVCISMSQSLTEIGDYAFESNTSLLSVAFPATVTNMGLGLFQGCAALESLTLPFVGGTREENTFLGYLFGASAYTFTEGFLPTSFMEVILSEGCSSIPDNAFCFASWLRRVEIPASCTSVGRRAFYGCKRLAAVDLSGVAAIGDMAFMDCISLSDVTLGNTLFSVGVQAFYDCTALSAVDLPSSLTAIPASCFDGCVSLSRVSWGAGLASIGKNAFRRCTGLTDTATHPAMDGIAVESGNDVLFPPSPTTTD